MNHQQLTVFDALGERPGKGDILINTATGERMKLRGPVDIWRSGKAMLWTDPDNWLKAMDMDELMQAFEKGELRRI